MRPYILCLRFAKAPQAGKNASKTGIADLDPPLAR